MSRHRRTRERTASDPDSLVRLSRMPERQQRRRRWTMPLGVLLALAAVGGLIAGYFSNSNKPVSAPPAIELANLDPAVARILGERIEEVRRHPGSSKAWGTLGGLLRSYELLPEARTCLLEAARLDPSEPRWPYFLGLMSTRNTAAETEEFLHRAAELSRNDPPHPRLKLARLLVEAGRWEDANRELEPLLSAKPDFTPGMLLAAQAAQARSDVTQAVSLARLCVNDPRTRKASAQLLAGLYQRIGNTNGAADAARAAAMLPADDRVPDPFEAEVTAMRGDARGLSDPIHALLAAGRLDEATVQIDRLVREHPTFSETWLLLGRLQILRKDPAAAETSLRRHLELDPRSSQGKFQLGMAQMQREHWDEAAATFLQATELKPDFGPAFFNRGYALARGGHKAEAVAPFEAAIRLNPEHLESYVLLADLHLQLGDRAAAQARFQAAQTINPRDPRVRNLAERLR